MNVKTLNKISNYINMYLSDSDIELFKADVFFNYYYFSRCSRLYQNCGQNSRTRLSCWTSSVTSASTCSPSSPPRPRFSLRSIWETCSRGVKSRRMNRDWRRLQVKLDQRLREMWTVGPWPHVTGFSWSLSPGHCVVPAEMESRDWLQPETAGFSELLLQYNGFCGSTFVSKDGLLLPGAIKTHHRIF